MGKRLENNAWLSAGLQSSGERQRQGRARAVLDEDWASGPREPRARRGQGGGRQAGSPPSHRGVPAAQPHAPHRETLHLLDAGPPRDPAGAAPAGAVTCCHMCNLPCQQPQQQLQAQLYHWMMLMLLHSGSEAHLLMLTLDKVASTSEQESESSTACRL